MLMDFFFNFNVDISNSKTYKSSHFSQTYLFCFPFDSEFNAPSIDTHDCKLGNFDFSVRVTIETYRRLKGIKQLMSLSPDPE